ncbi:hypothetical protein PSTT_04997 [Puccinia striiformis]|uniref:Uncharacterized protein n=2 Tax=Puccinia striiformis TaxID=27350 RepID=A0A2S4VQH1_9BASI|nr:hypothetical protein PSTT_04997 [Puccinia striiformis]
MELLIVLLKWNRTGAGKYTCVNRQRAENKILPWKHLSASIDQSLSNQHPSDFTQPEMQLSNTLLILTVILVSGQAYVQCFSCYGDYPIAACGCFINKKNLSKEEANAPDQDGGGITLRRAHPQDGEYTCIYARSKRPVKACCHPDVHLNGKKMGLSKFENTCQRQPDDPK